MADPAALAAVDQGVGELLSQPEVFVELPKWQQPCITGDLAR